MAKVQQKSERITAFGGIFFVLDKFDRILSSVIDSHLNDQKNRPHDPTCDLFRVLLWRRLHGRPPDHDHGVGSSDHFLDYDSLLS